MNRKSHERRLFKAKDEAERLRYDASHKPVDDLGDSYENQTGPRVKASEPAVGDDRPRAPGRRGTLDPYHRGEPGEARPDDSPVRPKAPPVFQATEEGELAEPPKPKRQ